MITGTGIDIVEIKRIKKIANRQQRFVQRILTVREREVYASLSEHRRLEYLAGRFAAKEAVVKAVGTGIAETLGWHDIEILNDRKGKPLVQVAVAGQVHLSISHSKEYAVAQVIIESLS